MKDPDWPHLLLYLCDVWEEPTLNVVGTPCKVTGGYSRTIWSLELGSSDWPASRMYQVRCSDDDGSGLELEVARLGWLMNRGYPVTPQGFLVSDPSVIGRPFALLVWAVGRSLAEIVQADGWGQDWEHAREIGKLLSRLHSIPPLGFPGKTTSSLRSRGLDHISLASELLGGIRTGLLNDLIVTYRLQSLPNVVCHLDLHPRNIVITEEGACVIDWEKAARAHPLMDIAMAQVHTEMAIALGEYSRLDNSPGFARCLLDAYLGSRPIACRDLGFFRILACSQRLYDVAGALQRAVLLENDRAELHAEAAVAAVAIELLDRESLSMPNR